MFYNVRSIYTAALVAFFAYEACAIDLKPILGAPDYQITGSQSKRATPEGVTMVPIDDPEKFRTGKSRKREEPGNSAFDPSKVGQFFWGAYAGDNIYVANFTVTADQDDEFILPVEKFAKRLKSLNCGDQGKGPINLEFADADSFKYARDAWKWVDDEDINHFILVTEPDQCYKGDNRSPYLVQHINFDEASLKAVINAEERPWSEVAQSYTLNLKHEYVDPSTANVTHPHLMRREENGRFDIGHTFNHNLFNYAKDSSESAGAAVSVDAELTTAGAIVTDFEIEKTRFIPIPKDVILKVHPQGVNAIMKLILNVDGQLGKGIEWSMKPEIEIPISALNIKGLLEVGPFITMGIHMGASGLQGTGTATIGAKATIKDDAEVIVKLRHPEENSIKGWTPDFEKQDPSFSAEIGGDMRAWNELGVTLKVEVLGKWGYQASVDAQLPFVEAKMSAIHDPVGVCDSKKTKGVNLGADVGINVNLNAGKVNEAPDFQKDLFETSWNLFTTCIGIGDDDAKPTDVPVETTAEAEPTTEPEPEPEPTEPVETPVSGIDDLPLETDVPLMTGTGGMPMMTGTGTGSAGYPIPTANTTFLKMVRRSPTLLY